MVQQSRLCTQDKGVSIVISGFSLLTLIATWDNSSRSRGRGTATEFCVVDCVVTPVSLPVLGVVGRCRSGIGGRAGNGGLSRMNTAPRYRVCLFTVAGYFFLQRTVTAEVAGSSPVVPAIQSKTLRFVWDLM